MEEMEKRSDRHIRDLVAHTAFKGLDANEIGCARISVMAGAIAPFKGPNTDEQDQLSPGRHIRLATHGRSIQNVPCVDGSELARAFFTFAALVGAAMCSAFRCGSHDRVPRFSSRRGLQYLAHVPSPMNPH